MLCFTIVLAYFKEKLLASMFPSSYPIKLKLEILK